MAFGLNVDFTGIIGNLTKSVRSIVSSKIGNMSKMLKSFSITSVTNGLTGEIKGIIGTGLNLNLSKLTGGINFSNALNGLGFPSLGNLNISSLYGLIDENIGRNINNFAKGLANTYKILNLDEISLGNKLTGAINNQVNNITDEIQAGTIVGKSSINVLGELNNLSNKQIRDFSFNPQLQLDFVNNLAEQQKNKIFDLSFNAIPESTIFDNQVNNLQNNSIDSFIGTTNLDFAFGNDKIINETAISKSLINNQQSQIFSITEDSNPLTRKIDLNRYKQEEKTLSYLEFLNDDFESTQTVTFTDRGPVESSGLEKMIDPDTGELLGYTDQVRNLILDTDYNPV